MPTKVCLIKAMIFPVVMYGCGSRTIKNTERWRIDAFELWCWRRLLRVPRAARIFNQSILKEISLEYSLEGLILKLQYFGHLMWRANSLEKTLMKDWGQGDKRATEDETVGWQHQLNGHEFEPTLGAGDWQGGLVCCSLWGHRQWDTTEWLKWTEARQAHISSRVFQIQESKNIYNLLKISRNMEASNKCLKLKWVSYV